MSLHFDTNTRDYERLSQIAFWNMLKYDWIVTSGRYWNHSCLRMSPVVSDLFFDKDPDWPRDDPIESHRVTSSHPRPATYSWLLLEALPMAQAASVFQGQRWQRWHSEFIVNSWSLARFVPVCLEVSFKRRSYATLFSVQRRTWWKSRKDPGAGIAGANMAKSGDSI